MSTPRKLGVAVIGTGSIGEHRVRLCRAAPDVDLLGIVDRNPTRAKDVGARYETPVWSERHLLDSKLDAVVISVPTEQHEAVTAPLLERGVAVLVEKPIAASLEQADRLIAAAETRGVLLHVGHTERFNPAVAALRDACHDPRFLEAQRLGSFQARSLDIDVILDLMIHDIDVILDLVRSEVERIDAVGVQALSSRLDIANARIAFDNGAAANITASRISVGKVRKLRVFESASYLSLDYSQQEVLHYSLNRPAEGSMPQIVSRTLPVERAEPLALELRNFLDTARSGEASLVNARQGRRALEVCLEVGARIREAGERARAVRPGR